MAFSSMWVAHIHTRHILENQINKTLCQRKASRTHQLRRCPPVYCLPGKAGLNPWKNMPLVSCKSWEEFPTTYFPKGYAATTRPRRWDSMVCSYAHFTTMRFVLRFIRRWASQKLAWLICLVSTEYITPIITTLSLLFSIFYRPEALTSAEDSWEWFLPNGCDSAPSVPYPSILLSQMLGANLIVSFCRSKDNSFQENNWISILFRMNFRNTITY